MNSWWRWRCMQRWMTLPSSTSRAAKSVVVPGRLVSHRAGAALFHRQAGLSAVERLDLALLVHRQHDGMRRQIDIEPDDIGELLEEVRVLREFERLHTVRRWTVCRPDALDRAQAHAGCLRHASDPSSGSSRRAAAPT